MDIAGIFKLSRGVTAFVGNISGQKNMIMGSKAMLVVDGKPCETIDKLNEAITNKPTKNDYRSLETSNRINLTQDFVNNHECKLIEIQR